MINTTSPGKFAMYPLSESAITIEFGNTINETIISRINTFDKWLNQKPFHGLYQTVPAYATLTVFFDPVKVIGQTQLSGKTCYDKVCSYLHQLYSEPQVSPVTSETEIISIPVCYGGGFGPDLDYVAAYHQLTTNEVIGLHSSTIYKVYMIGFIPGFAYLGGLNEVLATPRKATPVKVQAGAVGIAGKQTGIYPLATPGGWQIIGQTPFQMFDAGRPQSAFLKAGDRIRFEPVPFSDFEKLKRK
jgi:inhibitor of KinA